MHHVPDYLLPDWKKCFAENNYAHLLARINEEYENHPEEKQYLVPIHAMCNRMLKKLDENISLCTGALPSITNENAYSDTLQQLIATYEALGNKEEMLRLYKQLQERQPHTFWELRVADLCDELGYTEEAMVYRLLDAEDAEDEKVYKKIISYYKKKRDYNKAHDYLEKLARFPQVDAACYWCEAGRMKALAGERDEAMFLFKMVTKLDPEMASPYYFIGKLYDDAGDVYRAMDNYYKCLTIDQNYAEAYNNLGVIQYYEEGSIKDAIAFMEKAVTTNAKGQTLTLLYKNLTRLYKKIADYDKSDYYNQKYLTVFFGLEEEDDYEEEDDDETMEDENE